MNRSQTPPAIPPGRTVSEVLSGSRVSKPTIRVSVNVPRGGTGREQAGLPRGCSMNPTKRRGVDPYGGGNSRGHASQRRNGTGRWNPVQGLLVHGQRQAERPGTLVAPILAGIKPGRRFLGSVDREGPARFPLSRPSLSRGAVSPAAGPSGFADHQMHERGLSVVRVNTPGGHTWPDVAEDEPALVQPAAVHGSERSTCAGEMTCASAPGPNDRCTAERRAAGRQGVTAARVRHSSCGLLHVLAANP